MTARRVSVEDYRAGRVPGLRRAARPVPREIPRRVVEADGSWYLVVPVRTYTPNGSRPHHMVAWKRAKAVLEAVTVCLRRHLRRESFALPLVVTLTRVGPGQRADADNNVAALKHAQDSVAKWLGVDDADPRVTWVHAQTRGPWSVRVEIRAREEAGGE